MWEIIDVQMKTDTNNSTTKCVNPENMNIISTKFFSSKKQVMWHMNDYMLIPQSWNDVFQEVKRTFSRNEVSKKEWLTHELRME